MPVRPHEAAIRDRYDELSELYTELFADVAKADPRDRALFAAFAELVPRDLGPVADLGCGPGHWTGYLQASGLDVFGIDLSPAFLATARRAHAGLRFEEGSMASLDLADGSLAGVVAWYSIIHTPPDELIASFEEIARVLAPGGLLLTGFQCADSTETTAQPFDHKVVAGYRWPPDAISDLLREVGIAETTRLVREPGESERFRAAHLIGQRVASEA